VEAKKMNPENAIGKPVKFRFPIDLHEKGILEDRYWLPAKTTIGSGEYIDTIDLIDFHGKKFMRFGYYRNNRWAGQWTMTEHIDILKTLFVKTAQEKEWFRNFLMDVIKELK
jgi:hypothetical protein